MTFTVITWELQHDPAVPLSLVAESPQAFGVLPDLTNLIALHPEASSDDRAPGFLGVLHAMAASGYAVRAPGQWTVAVRDHGERPTFLAAYPTPAESLTALCKELHFQLRHVGLASFRVAAPDLLAAEKAVLDWYAAQRSDVDPAATSKPLAFPDTDIPGPGDQPQAEPKKNR